MYDEVLELLAVPEGQADAAQQHKLQEVWLGKARACQLLGRTEDAEAAFKASLDEGEEEGISGPGEAWRRRGAMEAHAALASIALSGGRTHEAVLRYTEAVETAQQELAAVGEEGAEGLGFTLRTLRCHRAAALLAAADYAGALEDCDHVLGEQVCGSTLASGGLFSFGLPRSPLLLAQACSLSARGSDRAAAEQVAANADALLLAFLTRGQCRAALNEWEAAATDYTSYLDATRQADAEGSLDGSAEAAARRRQRAEVFLKRSQALLGMALALGEPSDGNRKQLQGLYTSALCASATI